MAQVRVSKGFKGVQRRRRRRFFILEIELKKIGMNSIDTFWNDNIVKNFETFVLKFRNK